MEPMTSLRELAEKSNAWPFQEARKVVQRLGGKVPAKGYALFQTGYGPSGLPHIGTFGEVARTTMVRNAFALLSDAPSRLYAFSDDMDGLRRVPDNVPNREMMTAHLGRALTSVPDPFGTHESFGHHNNARLRAFLDRFGFEYEFKSATECYKSGAFDQTLLRVLKAYDRVMAIMLPSLGEERQRTYSPFLPVSPKTGRVLQVPIERHDEAAGTVMFRDEDGTPTELPVTGGHCKLQWKVDWAMRWVAFDVDYEMAGKDLIDSVRLSGEIAKALGAKPPENVIAELFLDENGEKISKSKGNGLAIEEWLAYAPRESVSYFMFQQPKRAKRLYFDVIPRQVDEYLGALEKFQTQEPAARLDNPVWHIHNGRPPSEKFPVGFGLLLNLASVCNTEDTAVLWGFVERYAPGANAKTHPFLDAMIGFALAYYRDFVKPSKHYRQPNEAEREALEDLAAALANLPRGADAEAIQNEIYAVGKRHPFADLRAWFQALYEILLGQSQGPRLGSFFALYGLDETDVLIRKALAGEALA